MTPAMAYYTLKGRSQMQLRQTEKNLPFQVKPSLTPSLHFSPPRPLPQYQKYPQQGKNGCEKIWRWMNKKFIGLFILRGGVAFLAINNKVHFVLSKQKDTSTNKVRRWKINRRKGKVFESSQTDGRDELKPKK